MKNSLKAKSNSLYIPFGEYKNGTFVEGSCEGYATLLIKIVPEYLTWKARMPKYGIMTETGISLRKGNCI